MELEKRPPKRVLCYLSENKYPKGLEEPRTFVTVHLRFSNDLDIEEVLQNSHIDIQAVQVGHLDAYEFLW